MSSTFFEDDIVLVEDDDLLALRSEMHSKAAAKKLGAGLRALQPALLSSASRSSTAAAAAATSLRHRQPATAGKSSQQSRRIAVEAQARQPSGRSRHRSSSSSRSSLLLLEDEEANDGPSLTTLPQQDGRAASSSRKHASGAAAFASEEDSDPDDWIVADLPAELAPAPAAPTGTRPWFQKAAPRPPLRADIVALPPTPSPAEFVHVQPNIATLVRTQSHRHPAIAAAGLWIWFTLLILGELGTTIWWLRSLGPWGVLALLTPLVCSVFAALLVLSPEQVLAILVSIVMAVVPALPAYSAVLLLAPPPGDTSGQCWEPMHIPTVLMLSLMYISATFVPALRAEGPAVSRDFSAALVTALESAGRLAQGACIIAVWLYAAVAVHVAAFHLSGLGDSPTGAPADLVSRAWAGVLAGPLAAGRGPILALNALGLLCAEARQRTAKALGNQLLPWLLGSQRAKDFWKNFWSLTKKHSWKLLKRVVKLRQYSPPTIVVALVVAVRRTAPVLFLLLAFLVQSAPSLGIPLSLLLSLALTAVLAAATARELKALPTSTLRRLPLLLPSGIAPCTRKCLGYALVVAEKAEGVRSTISSLYKSGRKLVAL
eukprot:TRINITY_DN13523_c0_g2_i3.p1 TRINITY_DN13523_c0_g2~~TRINITY_DN13523_c0_g2_i3.p1  ORF type:complete len:612 (+),score=136.85 TRINITY_DN13523_c0_g2_i3:35-1837(+)